MVVIGLLASVSAANERRSHTLYADLLSDLASEKFQSVGGWKIESARRKNSSLGRTEVYMSVLTRENETGEIDQKRGTQCCWLMRA